MLHKLKRHWNNWIYPPIGLVWELHRVTWSPSPDLRYMPYDITPERLETLIVAYSNQGYKFISIDDLCDILQHLQRMSAVRRFLTTKRLKKFICITLDDGYEDNYVNAYPLFRQYRVPFCIYVTSSYIDGDFMAREDTPPSLRTWQIQEMATNPLCTIGAHTKTHPKMTALSDEQQREELFGSIQQLEMLTSSKINHITIPYGAYNQTTHRLVSELDIRSNVMGWGGPVRSNCTPLSIPRIIIEQNKITL